MKQINCLRRAKRCVVLKTEFCALCIIRAVDRRGEVVQRCRALAALAVVTSQLVTPAPRDLS